MIVDPDFIDHWRTRMLADALGGDDLAPVYIIRVWSHCQSRRSVRFDGMSSAGLKAVCRYKGDADAFEAAMVESGFIVRDEYAIEVPKWADHNAQLIRNWENGKTGGRPKGSKNKPNGNPMVSVSKPSANPMVSQSEPIREEKRREEKRRPPKPPKGGETKTADPAEPERQSQFETFWEAYPPRNGHKAGKAEACRRFAALTPADVPLAIQAARHYAAHCRTGDALSKDAERFLRLGRGKGEPWREWVDGPANESEGDDPAQPRQEWTVEDDRWLTGGTP